MDKTLLDHSTTAKNTEKLRIEPVQSLQASLTLLQNEEKISDRFRIILIKTGTGTLTMDDAVVPWISPCILCLNEKTTISISEQKEHKPEIPEIFILYFHPRFINKKLDFKNIRIKGMDVEPEVIENRLILRPFTEEKPVLINHIAPEATLRIQNLLENCQTELTEQPTGWWPCRTRSYITELLFFITQLKDKNLSKAADFEKIQTTSFDFKPILDFIMREYNKPMSLDGLCSKFATNRTTLNGRFRTETGMTAIAYIIDLRLRIAATMLTDTDLPVAEIADRTGHSDTTHFERLFKKKYNSSPSAYRANTR